ncbi:ATP-binding protein [Streptomyces sp. NPDC048172]|uniref:ATP-binding protein n=1 Tax=Streptomyces sp. NPDC048172 TaxID=3365505 RepID=UPI0037197B67
MAFVAKSRPGATDFSRAGRRRPEVPEERCAVEESGQGARAGNGRPGNLPPEPTSFVGRTTELASVAAALTHARLVTLTGVGGVGKTRLAQRAGAEAARAAFPDGVWLVELSPLRTPTPNLIALSVYEALRLADQSTQPAIEVVTDWLADKRLLLILDCCEHLTADCSAIVRALLAAAPGVRVLATSRCPLKAPGEHVVAVPPLPVTAAGHARGAAPADAARLFMDRAARAAPGAEKDGGAVAEICVRLEGIPLAIELAAARLSEMSLAQLRQRLHTRFETLTMKEDERRGRHGPYSPYSPYSRFGAGEARHRTLRTAIGWSHELCTPQERLLWARLSVFADGFEQEAVERVCADGSLGGHQMPGLLNRLVETSLLQRTGTPRGPRYSMLDTVREYGQEWLARLGEEQRLRERHRDYFRELAHLAEQEWMGSGQVAWYERSTAEHANFRAALDSCLTAPDPLLALGMASDLWFFWLCCGFLREGRDYLDRALRQAPPPGRPMDPVRSKAVWACGAIALGRVDLDTAAHRGKEFRAEAEAAADPPMLNGAAHLDGGYLVLIGQPAQGAAVFDAAPYTEDHGSTYSGSRFLVWALRAFAHSSLGEFAEAAALTDAMRAECVERGERWALAYADYVRGLAARGLGRLEEAAAYARTSLEGKALFHDSIGICTAIDLLASVAADNGHGERAARLLGVGQQAWALLGRSRLGIPELLAARAACERQAREAAGDAAYEAAFAKGLTDSLAAGIAYALRPR